jgi:hypothetical protein
MGGHLTPLTRSTDDKCTADSLTVGCIVSTASLLRRGHSFGEVPAVVAQIIITPSLGCDLASVNVGVSRRVPAEPEHALALSP